MFSIQPRSLNSPVSPEDRSKRSDSSLAAGRIDKVDAQSFSLRLDFPDGEYIGLDPFEKGGLLGEIRYGDSISGFNDSMRFSEIIFSLPEKSISGIEKIGDNYFIFKVEKYIPGDDRSLAEVINQVKEDAFRDKEFAEAMKLMERLRKTHDVMILENVVLGMPSK